MSTDIINYLIILTILFFLVINKRLPIELGLSLSITALIPFVLIGTLIPIGLFSDVIQFTIYTQFLRAEYGLADYPVGWQPITHFFGESIVHITSRFFSLIPLPFIDTFRSLGFFNVLIYISFITYLYSKKILNNKLIMFFILCPSVALHYSIGLRETIVLCSTLLLFLYLIEKKYFLFLFYFFILFIFKFTNAFLLIVPIGMYFIFLNESQGYKKVIKLFFVLLMVILFITFIINYSTSIIEFINGYRNNRFREHGLTDIIFADDFFRMFMMMLAGIPKFFFTPTIFNSENSFQLFVAIETIALNLFVIYLFIWSFKKSKIRALYWLLSFILCGMVFSYVVENIGLIYRYRMPFYMLYIFGVVYDIKYHIKKKEKKFLY